MSKYTVRFVHKISNAGGYTPGDDVELEGGVFSDSKKLAKALRDKRVLLSGARVRNFQVEGSKVVVFPTLPGITTYWHAVVLELVPEPADLRVQDAGSVFLLHPASDAGQDWLDENLGGDEVQRLGNAVAVEHRYILDIVDGAKGDGLVVERA